MITIINERNGYKTKFKNYKKLYYHIEHNQRAKRYNNSQQPIDDWFFDRHSYRRAMAFYDFVCAQKEAAKETPEWENSKFDVLEMSYDKSVRPVIIPITPDIDIESHLEDWCRKYCEFHGFKLVEIKDNDGILRVKKERADIANIGVTYNVWWR